MPGPPRSTSHRSRLAPQWVPPCRTTRSPAFRTTARHSCRSPRQVGWAGPARGRTGLVQLPCKATNARAVRQHVRGVAHQATAPCGCGTQRVWHPFPAHPPMHSIRHGFLAPHRRVKHLVHIQKWRLRNNVGDQHGDSHCGGEQGRPFAMHCVPVALLWRAKRSLVRCREPCRATSSVGHAGPELQPASPAPAPPFRAPPRCCGPPSPPPPTWKSRTRCSTAPMSSQRSAAKCRAGGGSTWHVRCTPCWACPLPRHPSTQVSGGGSQGLHLLSSPAACLCLQACHWSRLVTACVASSLRLTPGPPSACDVQPSSGRRQTRFTTSTSSLPPTR